MPGTHDWVVISILVYNEGWAGTLWMISLLFSREPVSTRHAPCNDLHDLVFVIMQYKVVQYIPVQSFECWFMLDVWLKLRNTSRHGPVEKIEIFWKRLVADIKKSADTFIKIFEGLW